jgi:hypothetical protein
VSPSDDGDDELSLHEAQRDTSGGEEAAATVSSELAACRPCDNCVLYARCKQPALPRGLFSYADKVSQINSHTPQVGCVAVIRSRSAYGHVGYVNGVSGGLVHIDEANWTSGRCGARSGTATSLNITGYICP